MNDRADVELICYRKFPNGISVQSMGRPLQRTEQTKGEETMSNLNLWHNNTLNNLSMGLAQDPYRESCHSASSQSIIFCNSQQRYWTVISKELLNAWPDGQRDVIAVTLRLVSTFQSIISRGDFKTCDFLLKNSQRKFHSAEERRYSVNFSPKINTDWSDSARERFFAMRFGEKWNFDQKLVHRWRPIQLTESYSESFETKCFSTLQQRFGRDTEGKLCFVFRTHRAWGESEKMTFHRRQGNSICSGEWNKQTIINELRFHWLIAWWMMDRDCRFGWIWFEWKSVRGHFIIIIEFKGDNNTSTGHTSDINKTFFLSDKTSGSANRFRYENCNLELEIHKFVSKSKK